MSFVGMLLLNGAAGAATVETARTAFRNATVVGIDGQSRRIVADFGNGQASLEVENGIPLTSIALGDPIVLGIRNDGANTSRVVYLRRSLAAAPAPAATTSPDSMAVSMSSDGVRRPMHVVPNPKDRARMKAVRPVDTPHSLLENAPQTLAYGGKVSAIVYTDPEPEPAALSAAAPVSTAPAVEPSAPMTSSLDSMRRDGAAQLETRLDSVDILARQADASWHALLRACPGAGPADVRGWLSVSTPSAAGPSGCEALYQRALADADRARTAIRDAESAARGAWLPPGTIRDAFRRRGLEMAAR